MDGTSLVPALRGELFERGPIESMFGHTVRATGSIANVWIRDGKWKLLRFLHTGRDQQDELELYDITNDIGETENLAHVYPEVAQRLNDQLSAQLEAEGALLPRRNPNYNPDFSQAGFRMGRGGFLIGGPNQNQAVFTAKSSRVTLYFDASAKGGSGDTLAFTIMTNSAISATAGAGKTPVFGPSVTIKPDLQAREIRVPLGRMVTGGEITVVFDLEQPGRSHLTNPRLMNAGHSVAIKPRVETGLPSFSFEARPGQPFGDWLPMNDLAAVGVHAGVLHVKSAAEDPYFVASTVHFHADAVDVISVKMMSDTTKYPPVMKEQGGYFIGQLGK